MAEMPEMITLYGYDPMDASTDIERYCHDALETILENLDEDFSNPDGDPTKPTEGMGQALKALINAIKKDYQVWMCEEVSREEINVMSWIAENEPEWLKEEP